MDVAQLGSVVVHAIVGLQELEDLAGAKEVYLVVVSRSDQVAGRGVFVIGDDGIR